MKRFAVVLSLLFILISSSSISQEDEENICLCPAFSPDWAILSDTSTSIPDFFFQPYVAVKRMLVCEHGIYFFFKAREQGRHRHTCLAYPQPTEELYYTYFERDSLLEESAGSGLHTGPQKFINDYEQFKDRLREILGRRYVENQLVHFDRNHMQKPKLSFENPLSFRWRDRKSEFQGLLDVYFQEPRPHR